MQFVGSSVQEAGHVPVLLFDLMGDCSYQTQQQNVTAMLVKMLYNSLTSPSASPNWSTSLPRCPGI